MNRKTAFLLLLLLFAVVSFAILSRAGSGLPPVLLDTAYPSESYKDTSSRIEGTTYPAGKDWNSKRWSASRRAELRRIADENKRRTPPPLVD